MKSKVLVVDDEGTYRRLHERELSKLDYEVHTAANYSEAMDLLDRHFFHAATLDIRLEDAREENEEGMAILEKLDALGESTGVIMLTGFPTDERMRRAFKKYKVVDFLTKNNYDPSTLEASLNEAVQQTAEFLKRKQNIDFILSQLSTAFTLKDLQNETGESQQNIRLTLEGLLRSLGPIKTHPTTYNVREKIGVYTKFETKCWSRFLGKVVVIRAGHIDIISKERESLEEIGYVDLEDNEKKSIEKIEKAKKNNKVFKLRTSQKFSGLWYPIKVPDLFPV